GALLCVVDDAQWLDEASAKALAFVARRLDAEGVGLVLAMRIVGDPFADLPRLVVEGPAQEDARQLLRHAVPGPIDPRVRDQILAEARGNPLAIQEPPGTLAPFAFPGGATPAAPLPLEHRIEQSLLALVDPLPPRTRLLLLLAPAEPT